MLFVASALLYLVLVSAVCACLVLPTARQWMRGHASRTVGAGLGAVKSSAGLARKGLGWGRVPLAAGATGWSWMRQHARWLLAALTLLIAVPLAALWLRQWHAYDGYDHTSSRAVNPQVAALLMGEQLVPPAPLPPELFLTREVERLRPAIATASRHWDLLDAEFRNRLLVVYQVMRDEHGYEMVLLEGYRSPERQAQLAAMGTSVTHAGAGRSYHQYGLAADSAFVIDSRIVISEKDPRAARGYELFGSVAQAAGLVWGGSWRTLKDLGHVELRRPGVLQGAAASH